MNQFEIQRTGRDVVISCKCRKSTRCPTLSFEDGHVFIKDDFGGSVKIPADQALYLGRAVDTVLIDNSYDVTSQGDT